MGENITADWFWKVSHKFVSLTVQKEKEEKVHGQVYRIIYFSWSNVSMTSDLERKLCSIMHIYVQFLILCPLLFSQSVIWSSLFTIWTWLTIFFCWRLYSVLVLKKVTCYLGRSLTYEWKYCSHSYYFFHETSNLWHISWQK